MGETTKFIINGKYSLIQKIGSGSFGTIYKGENIRTFEKVAIKIEPIKNGTKLIKNESIIYTYLNGLKGIPNVKWFGKDNINFYMVINLLGESLNDCKKNKKKYTLHETLDIGKKCIILLESIHNKGIIHRDIKPENFLFGLNQFNNQIYIIDFGLAKTYIVNNKHIPLKIRNGLIGTRIFASINAHNFLELSRRDDLESLFYLMLYLYFDILDWEEIYSTNFENINNLTKQCKENLHTNKNVPDILLKYFTIIRQMKFEETPNYNLLIELFS